MDEEKNIGFFLLNTPCWDVCRWTVKNTGQLQDLNDSVKEAGIKAELSHKEKDLKELKEKLKETTN